MAELRPARFYKILSMMESGVSTFTFFPRTDYSKEMYGTATDITAASWEQTGNTLQQTIQKVGKRIEREHESGKI